MEWGAGCLDVSNEDIPRDKSTAGAVALGCKKPPLRDVSFRLSMHGACAAYKPGMANPSSSCVFEDVAEQSITGMNCVNSLAMHEVISLPQRSMLNCMRKLRQVLKATRAHSYPCLLSFHCG